MLVCLLSHAALVFGVYRLGAAVFGRWSGALAALFVAASASFLLYAARGYVDAPFLALVVWAGVSRPRAAQRRDARAARRSPACCAPRRGCSPACGGWRTAASRTRSRVAAAPLLWALTDLIVTGDPLHSLHATSELADDLGRVRGVQHVPGSFVSFVGATVRPPVALLAPVGRVPRVGASSAGARCWCRWRCSRRA